MITSIPQSHRKSSFKAPPTTITDRLVSQDARRQKALEDQKRRRASKIESSRNLDSFASLTIDEDDDEIEDDDPDVIREGIASFAPMLETTEEDSANAKSKKKTRKRKSKGKRNATTRWADKCMYAELLEIEPSEESGLGWNDGLPEDLETGWIAVPVPSGKRCLAVTYQSLGRNGPALSAPSSLVNLHSRAQGKAIMRPFPSPFPPNTILDCILDSNWRHQENNSLGNQILHVLDVIRWNGRDVGSCEVGFRFWWRDTRFQELAPLPRAPSRQTQIYPTSFLPIPYFTDLSLDNLVRLVLPAAKSSRNNAPPEEDMMDIGAHVNPVVPDGLLLYVKEASYESGTSPLSCWIPPADPTNKMGGNTLDRFESLVHRRLSLRFSSSGEDNDMHMDI